MLSHVIPKWPRGENMVTENFGIPIIPYYPVWLGWSHPVTSKNGLAARLCQGAMQISSSTLAQCSKFFRLLGPFLACIREGLVARGHYPWWESVQFDGSPGNLCLWHVRYVSFLLLQQIPYKAEGSAKLVLDDEKIQQSRPLPIFCYGDFYRLPAKYCAQKTFKQKIIILPVALGLKSWLASGNPKIGDQKLP